MNIKQIKELAQIVHENGLSVLEISENEVHIRLERETKVVVAAAPEQMPTVAAEANLERPSFKEPDPVDFNRMHELKSQMVGVFYAAPAPDAKPFVSVGSKVKKGDIVCITEAMKLMNEIVSDFDGEIVDICVHNGDVVEYGQTLFKLC